MQTRDLVAMAQPRSLGIEKGKAFKPDEAIRATLRSAVAEVHARFMQEIAIVEPWWPGGRWGLGAGNIGAKQASRI